MHTFNGSMANIEIDELMRSRFGDIEKQGLLRYLIKS